MVKSPTEIEWEHASTLETWVKNALRQGLEKEVIAIIRCLPESSREKYRAIWKEWKDQVELS